VSIGQLAQRCIEAVGSDARIVSVDQRRRPEKSEVGLLLCDAARARALLGWAPQIKLEEGLCRTAEYLKAHLKRYRHNNYIV
jgi:nucleoside-diphosphate-sugar epimerase